MISPEPRRVLLPNAAVWKIFELFRKRSTETSFIRNDFVLEKYCKGVHGVEK